MKKVLIAFDIQEKEKAAFQEAVDRTGRDCELVFTPPAEVTAEQIQQANFILGNVPPQMIGASEKLDVLQVFTAGTDGYAVEGVLADKTVLCNGTGAYGLAVSEHAFALTMMLIGTQLFLTGFLGDLISRTSTTRNDYQIEEKI